MCSFEEVKWFRAKRIEVTSVICGTWHTGAVDEEGSLYTWGRGDHGQLGTGEVRPGTSMLQGVTSASYTCAVHPYLCKTTLIWGASALCVSVNESSLVCRISAAWCQASCMALPWPTLR